MCYHAYLFACAGGKACLKRAARYSVGVELVLAVGWQSYSQVAEGLLLAVQQRPRMAAWHMGATEYSKTLLMHACGDREGLCTKQ